MSSNPLVTEGYSSHVRECQARWENALEAEDFDDAVIHSGSEIYSFLDDYHYPFRPNPHFLQWLPLTRHHDSVLHIRPGEKAKLYYFQPDDYWYLPPSDPASWWASEFDIETVTDPNAWKQLRSRGRSAYIGDAPSLDGMASAEQINPSRLVNRIHLARTLKTLYEIACIAQSTRLAATAHIEAERAFREGCSEYEIHQRYCLATGLREYQLPYGNIVALNEHGAVLHYQQLQQDKPAESRSFLIDAGATQQGYCSDITRTYTTQEGEFKELIDAMDVMQQELCLSMRPGKDYRDLHVDTHLRISRILHEHGIIHASPEAAVESGLSAVFFPHGLGHYLGLQTHDVAGLIADEDGTPIPRPEGHPFLRLTRKLEPGNVLTVEPGLYFIDTLLSKWKSNGDSSSVNWEKVEQMRPFGGIRIEDNVVVTEDEPLNLTRAAFKQISPR